MRRDLEAIPLGLRRVSWVRVTVGPDGVRADVAGAAHRGPVVWPVPLDTAAALIARGVPSLVRHEPERRPAAVGA